MVTRVDLQMLVFMFFFAGATLVVALMRRKRRHPVQSRCRCCGRTLDLYRDKDGICHDCYRLERI